MNKGVCKSIMKYSIPVIPHDVLYKEHTEFFGNGMERLPFCKQIEFIMQKRKVTKKDLVEMTGLSPQRIDTIVSMKGNNDMVMRDHVYAVMISLRMDQCYYENAMGTMHYCFGGSFFNVHERDWYVRYFVVHSAAVEECTVANCNKSLIDAGFEPLTDLLLEE